MHKLLFVCSLFLAFCPFAKSQTVLQGQITDKIEPLIGSSITALQNGQVIKKTMSDVGGNYEMQLDSGIYQVEISYTGYQNYRLEKVEILPGKPLVINALLADINLEKWYCFFGWKIPLLSEPGTESGQTFTADQIRHMY
ncbi:MAG: carboxypeptidase-like regulatory domain-containing protein [Saprospiraceae bacterium]